MRTARLWLHRALPAGEFHAADGGCKCSHGPSVLIDDVPQNERRAFKLIRSRHETVNGRFKEWKVSSGTCRHHEVCHGAVFRAIAVITQLDIEDGRPVWNVGGIQMAFD